MNGHDDIMVPTVNSFILQQNYPTLGSFSRTRGMAHISIS